jgi:hypothetical protein
MAFEICTASPPLLQTVLDWAAAEGWNPGLQDAACFHAQDPHGFFVGVLDGRPISAVSVVNYGEDFAFLGLYIVHPDHRGQGWGWRTWTAGLAHAGTRPVGLDGVAAQQQAYQRSGFVYQHATIRYSGQPHGLNIPLGATQLAAAPTVPFDSVLAYDTACFGTARPAFLRQWLHAPGHVALVLPAESGLAGYGVLRPCRDGSKIGPLFADTADKAAILFAALIARAPAGPVAIDCAEPNAAARTLAEAYGLTPSFATARMLTGAFPPVSSERIFGVTTLELG